MVAVTNPYVVLGEGVYVLHVPGQIGEVVLEDDEVAVPLLLQVLARGQVRVERVELLRLAQNLGKQSIQYLFSTQFSHMNTVFRPRI